MFKKKDVYVNSPKNQNKTIAMLCVTLTLCSTLIWYNNYQEYKVLMQAHDQAIIIYEQIIERRDAGVVKAAKEVTAVSDEEITEIDTPQSVSVKEQIKQVAKEEGFNDSELLVTIAFCESSLNPQATNEHSSAIGLYQILDMHGLTVEERMDVEIATKWTINKINNGGLSAWNASRQCWGQV